MLFGPRMRSSNSRWNSRIGRFRRPAQLLADIAVLAYHRRQILRDLSRITLVSDTIERIAK